ncbi:hypothetical protein K491DRAFT_123438 [Lophiostoma macrostomum CBS 122681]|uniref:Uncharacterized protein n=1 Tax=Lophiostoma macrostomum CBS 122681 TaxID=1314788 RepID=A0A6A6TKY3_9PLEO|nr:hypothetical protein K491DRAFT_123438 [Lophiostoma macrostomum CBS 122681]
MVFCIRLILRAFFFVILFGALGDGGYDCILEAFIADCMSWAWSRLWTAFPTE